MAEADAEGEQIKEAEAFKEEGNRFFKEGSYKRALVAYHKVFCYVNGLQPDKAEEVKPLKQSTRLNMAACYLKLGEHQKCVDTCTSYLELGSSSKAHFRRGQAYAELRNFSGAKRDLERARELAPEDAAVVPALRKIRAAETKGDEKEKKRFAKMFGEARASAQSSVEEQVPAPAAARDWAGPRIEEVFDEEEQVAPAFAAGDAVGPRIEEAGDTPAAASVDAPAAGIGASAVEPMSLEVKDEARKLDVVVRELTYAWQQTDEEVKVYIPFHQSDELEGGVDESRVQVEFAEWSILLVVKSTVEGRTPLGLRLGDFHRRIAPERCKCTMRGSRITLKLVKQVKEHWWNFLQHLPLPSG